MDANENMSDVSLNRPSPQDNMDRLMILLEALIEEHSQTNQFLAQIVAHNADLLETGEAEEEPTSYLSGAPIL